MSESNMLLNAIYDPAEGQTWLAHPTMEGVYVDRDHFDQLMTDPNAATNCTYTVRTLCARYFNTPSGPICAEPMEIRTCNCT